MTGPSAILELPNSEIHGDSHLSSLEERAQFLLLPAELWGHIFKFLKEPDFEWSNVLRTCQMFYVLANPFAYALVRLTKLSSFAKLFRVVEGGGSSLGDVMRPGRWIHLLDISQIPPADPLTPQGVDFLLTHIYPLLPQLAVLKLNPAFGLFSQTVLSLAQHPQALNLRSLSGVAIHFPLPGVIDRQREIALLSVLRVAHNLESLDIVGGGFDAGASFNDYGQSEGNPDHVLPLGLPNLRSLSLVSTPRSLVMEVLIRSVLPNLVELTLTPYHDVPYPSNLSTRLVEVHGPSLSSLTLTTPIVWPMQSHASPTSVFEICPHLRCLYLDNPLPALKLVDKYPSLHILSLPRPGSGTWPLITRLLPFLPGLDTVRIRDFRWLRSGLNAKAQVTGIQGEVSEWRRRLHIKGVRLLDADEKGLEP